MKRLLRMPKPETLKPCPLCGRAPDVDEEELKDLVLVVCNVRRTHLEHSVVTIAPTRARAIAAWNRRSA